VIVAPKTAESAAAAFEKLSQATALREAPRPQILMPEPGRTLEDVVRDLMRPLIKEWLDENLAEIVERRVEEEIERIVKHRVR
jgi:cell pole-organizing protein PopZ